MKLCQKCINDAYGEDPEHDYFFSSPVVESECEFWAHRELRTTLQELMKPKVKFEVREE